MCLKRLNYDRKELERRREDSGLDNTGQLTAAGTQLVHGTAQLLASSW